MRIRSVSVRRVKVSSVKPKRRYKYLGKKVKDRGKPGYDSYIEGKDIAKAILRDFEEHRISRKLAVTRLNLLELATQRNSMLSQWEKKVVRNFIDESIRPKLNKKRKR
ncbi:MAG: hypothetical protein J7K23_04225 [Thermoproteales archaeon]|nr:hypothetical protein [Thermoproteales archaeon]